MTDYSVRVLGHLLLVDGRPAAAHIDHENREIIVQHEMQAAAIYADRVARDGREAAHLETIKPPAAERRARSR